MDKATAQKIKDYFAQHRPEIVSDFIELVKAESPSTNREATNRCADVIDTLVKKHLGLESRRFPQAEYGDHMLFEAGGGNRKFLLIGHYDTVWDVGAKPTVLEGDIVRGPGCFDMKYGIISSIWSLKAVADLGLPMDKRVDLFYNADEEVGSLTSMPIVLKNPAEYEAAVILEPAHEGGVKTERKGVGMFEITVTGLASHAGADYEKGISAIDEAAKIVAYLHSLTDLAAGTTVNVGVIEGGSRSNVVAAECRMSVDFRVTSAQAGDALVEKVFAIKPSRPGIQIAVTGGLNRPPFEKTPANQALFGKLAQVARDMDIEIFEISVGGGSDGNFTSHAGIATIDGMGAVGDGGHALSEYVDIPKSLERTALLTAFWAEA